ncbi:MAG: HIT domain-containing protein [Bacteroidales bacterium]|jgi:histidine triad (HIT) family protein|nr:HIT domain-containing protein [Bacteroidales bacterium]HOL98095.1 HIT domain-containing protein [Bacteroidales bacterium]HOM36204.1 HIT domain-containing protein [Bacteroidales bacterium]HPD23735.1 HIT domain-containing protein [Bacteroidales bacterium]HRS99787.1 HIT domain-containing protein [Bacteroidales bacterium]
MASIFTRIIKGEISCYKIAEDENFIAFLDINPLKKGHTLVVPKKEVDYIFDNSDEILSKILVFAKRVAKAIEKNVTCKRIGIVVIGLEVPHTHIHLIPMDKESDLSFSNPRVKLTAEEFSELATNISASVVL